MEAQIYVTKLSNIDQVSFSISRWRTCLRSHSNIAACSTHPASSRKAGRTSWRATSGSGGAPRPLPYAAALPPPCRPAPPCCTSKEDGRIAPFHDFCPPSGFADETTRRCLAAPLVPLLSALQPCRAHVALPTRCRNDARLQFDGTDSGGCLDKLVLLDGSKQLCPPPPETTTHSRACRPAPLWLRSSGRWGHHTSIASRSLTFEVRPFVVRPYRPAHLPPGLHQSTAQQQADPRAAMRRCCSWVPDFYFPPSVRHSIGAKNDGQVRPHSSSLQGWVSASAGSTSGGGGGGSGCTVFLQQQQQRVAFRMGVSNSSTLSHPSARVSADRYLPQRKCPLEPAASPYVELQSASLGPPWALPSAACPKQQDGEAGPGS